MNREKGPFSDRIWNLARRVPVVKGAQILAREELLRRQLLRSPELEEEAVAPGVCDVKKRPKVGLYVITVGAEGKMRPYHERGFSSKRPGMGVNGWRVKNYCKIVMLC